MKSKSNMIDLSHVVHDGLVTYRGLPAPVICDYWTREDSRARYSDGTEFQIGKIELVGNTGTYLDAPFHRFEDGEDLASISIDRVANLPGVTVKVPFGLRAIGADLISDLDVAGKAVLFRTDWSRHWNTERYFEGHPFLLETTARLLSDRKAALVGIDSFNIDDTDDGRRPVHTTLLGSRIPIVEHLVDLDRLPDADFEFFAPPVKIVAFGSFPVRAFALTAAP